MTLNIIFEIKSNHKNICAVKMQHLHTQKLVLNQDILYILMYKQEFFLERL